jgi:hypothetical protein
VHNQLDLPRVQHPFASWGHHISSSKNCQRNHHHLGHRRDRKGTLFELAKFAIKAARALWKDGKGSALAEERLAEGDELLEARGV